jgi:hypothetical protein
VQAGGAVADLGGGADQAVVRRLGRIERQGRVIGADSQIVAPGLGRRVDLAMFRVEAEGVDRASGLVDLQMRSTVQLRTP